MFKIDYSIFSGLYFDSLCTVNSIVLEWAICILDTKSIFIVYLL